MKELTTAVVGVGTQGERHAQKFATLAGSRLVAVADTDGARGTAVAAAFGAQWIADYRQLLGKVDAVCIAVPTAGHFSIARDFIVNGADVLLEKPMTATLAEADSLIAAAAEHGRILHIGHIERFNPALIALGDMGGAPRFIEALRIASFQRRSSDVSVILDLMIHDIDLILGIVKLPIRQVDAHGTPVISDDIDIANARLTFADGCVANVTASRVSLKTERTLRLFYPNCYVALDMLSRRLRIYRRDPAADTPTLPGIAIDERSFESGDAMLAQDRAFLDSVRERRPPPVPGEAGRDALATAIDITSILRRHETGVPA